MKGAALLYFVFAASLLAQTVTLRGVVTDETGAVIRSATVTVTGPNGAKSVTTGDTGSATIGAATSVASCRDKPRLVVLASSAICAM